VSPRRPASTTQSAAEEPVLRTGKVGLARASGAGVAGAARLCATTAGHATRLAGRSVLACEAGRACGSSAGYWIGAAGLVCAATRHAGCGLARGIRRRATTVRAARTAEPTTTAACSSRTGGGDPRTALQSRGLARRSAATDRGYAASAVQAKIAWAARLSAAAASSTRRGCRKGAGLTDRVGRRTGRVRTTIVAGAAAVTAGSARTGSRERAGTSASTGSAEAANATPITRTSIARAAGLAGPAARRPSVRRVGSKRAVRIRRGVFDVDAGVERRIRPRVTQHIHGHILGWRRIVHADSIDWAAVNEWRSHCIRQNHAVRWRHEIRRCRAIGWRKNGCVKLRFKFGGAVAVRDGRLVAGKIRVVQNLSRR